MRNAFQSVALIGKITNPEIREQAFLLARFLDTRSVDLCVESRTAEAFGITSHPTYDIETLGAYADLAIVLGGDGTMLVAARALLEYEIPLVGVNRGGLGFLTDIRADEMIDAVGRILDGEYDLEQRIMLGATLLHDGQVISTGRAFNDVVVSKGTLAQLIELELVIDGEFVQRMRSDGLIVSTPTGTTAYSLSAGGPILHPGVYALALVPICPHTLSNRPLAISSASTVEVTVIDAMDARAHFDGQLHADLEVGSKVVIRRMDRYVTLLHPRGHSYYAMLRDKMNWG
ncbi:MAG: NAD(+) kinase [Methylophilaceae bacterium]|nr:NAD(+) kinase [Methylophilaceae bacterium]